MTVTIGIQTLLAPLLLMLFGLVLAANRLGDWLRDRLDPTLAAA